MTADLWVVTAYYNPCRYRIRRANYDRFEAGMRAVGANLLTVELAFGEEDFELPDGPDMLRFRSNSVMWQKERMLNLAVAHLPAECRKVGWSDCDILFDDPRWLERTSAALDRAMVVQPFSSCNLLARDEVDYPGSDGLYESFAHCFVRAPSLSRSQEFFRHGHTGFAWAARRELFESGGLYDVCLAGSGDHLMAHAFAGGMIHSPCLLPKLGDQTVYARHFWRWAAAARDLVDEKLGYVPGTVLHLWHGPQIDRRYAELNRELWQFGFDPDRHLRIDEAGLYDWTDETPPEMRAWALENFRRRREDGDPAEEPSALAE